MKWNFCPSCGHKLEAKWKHCAECGEAIGELATPQFIPLPYPVYPNAYPTVPITSPYQPLPNIIWCGDPIYPTGMTGTAPYGPISGTFTAGSYC